MRCPKCTSIEDKVIDSRISKEGTTIRRRRKCLECGHRFSTTEVLIRDGMAVIKRDGRREDFDRGKLARSVRSAIHKRLIDAEQVEMLIEDVMDALEAEYEKEIPSHAIGQGVMERLRTVDPIAYLRFASVYKDLRDVAGFVDEISAMEKKPPR
jgi:transcriptional repressor NrdR